MGKLSPISQKEPALKSISDHPIEINAEVVQELRPSSDPTAAKDIEVVSGHAFSLNALGQKIYDEALLLYPQPILFLGGSGLGKSILAKQLAKQVGQGYASINADEGMDLSPLVGQWTPKPTDHGVTVEWNDGELTRSITEGSVFLFEEITRAPVEFLSRLFGLLDSDGRSWAIIEKDGQQVPISNKFWFIATGNPSGGHGYNTRKLDAALIDRFSAVYQIDEPLASEQEVLESYVNTDMAGQIMKLAEDLRSNPHTYVSTRGLIKIARHIKAGLKPVRAVEVAVAGPKDMSKEGIVKRGILELAEQHLVPVVAKPVRKNRSKRTSKRKHSDELGSTRHNDISNSHDPKVQNREQVSSSKSQVVSRVSIGDQLQFWIARIRGL